MPAGLRNGNHRHNRALRQETADLQQEVIKAMIPAKSPKNRAYGGFKRNVNGGKKGVKPQWEPLPNPYENFGHPPPPGEVAIPAPPPPPPPPNNRRNVDTMRRLYVWFKAYAPQPLPALQRPRWIGVAA